MYICLMQPAMCQVHLDHEQYLIVAMHKIHPFERWGADPGRMDYGGFVGYFSKNSVSIIFPGPQFCRKHSCIHLYILYSKPFESCLI